MVAWWRRTPLLEEEAALLEAVFKAHFQSTFRQNPSALAVQLVAQASGDYAQSIAAALMTGGGRHGPLEAAYDLLSHPNPAAHTQSLLEAGSTIPGWGSSFSKGAPDPIWAKPHTLIQDFPVAKIIGEVQAMMDRKHVYPNPSCYTAATAITLGIPRECTPWIAVAARLAPWSLIFMHSRGPKF